MLAYAFAAIVGALCALAVRRAYAKFWDWLVEDLEP
jgi:hypothetical protein